MAALGRILQVVGWLWLIIGFFGPMFGLLSLNLLPGIVLVFVARVIRNQADRTEMPELDDETSVEEQQRKAHQQPVQQPAVREPEPRDERPHRPPPEPYIVTVPDEPSPGRQRETSQEMLERIVGVRREAPDREEPLQPAEEEMVVEEMSRKPMSSAEMLARAHERWDSKDR